MACGVVRLGGRLPEYPGGSRRGEEPAVDSQELLGALLPRVWPWARPRSARGVASEVGVLGPNTTGQMSDAGGVGHRSGPGQMWNRKGTDTDHAHQQ